MIKIINGRVFDTDSKRFVEMDVEVESSVDRTIDASGKFVVPGLTDMHTHISPFYAKYYLLSGVTNVRNTAGMFELLSMIDDVSPDVYPTYRMIDGKPGLWGPSGDGHIATENIEEALEVVVENHHQGARFIKVYGHIKKDVLEAVVAKSKVLGLYVAADLIHSSALDALNAARLGVKYLEHASGILQCLYDDYVPGDFEKTFERQTVDLDREKLDAVLSELKSLGVVLVPTLSLYRKNAFGKITAPDSPLLEILRADKNVTLDKMFESMSVARTPNFKRYAEWEYSVMKIITKRYWDMGGEVYMGTDAPAGFWNYPGLSFIEEMQIFNELGIKMADVLHHAIVPGQRVVGAHSNFVICDADPLLSFDNLMAVSGVVMGGVYYSREDILSHTIDADAIYRKFEG